MSTEALRWFVEIMRHESFSEVARREGVAPSSVSRAITQLEEDLGIRLFQRTTRSLTPTEAAHIYHARVAGALEELELGRQQARDAVSRPAGKLRIGAATTFAHLHLVPHLTVFSSRYPDIDVEVALEDAASNLVARHLDVALRIGRLSDASLVARKLCDQRRIVCASPAYLDEHGVPERPQDLSSHDCLLFPHQGYAPRWRFRDASGRIDEVDVTGRITIGHGLSLRHCARDALGVALLPEWLISEDLASGGLVELLGDWQATTTVFDTAIWLVYPTRAYVPLKVRAFADFIYELFADGPPWIRTT